MYEQSEMHFVALQPRLRAVKCSASYHSIATSFIERLVCPFDPRYALHGHCEGIEARYKVRLP